MSRKKGTNMVPAVVKGKRVPTMSDSDQSFTVHEYYSNISFRSNDGFLELKWRTGRCCSSIDYAVQDSTGRAMYSIWVDSSCCSQGDYFRVMNKLTKKDDFEIRGPLDATWCIGNEVRYSLTASTGLHIMCTEVRPWMSCFSDTKFVFRDSSGEKLGEAKQEDCCYGGVCASTASGWSVTVRAGFEPVPLLILWAIVSTHL